MADLRIDQLSNAGAAARTDEIETDDGANSRRRSINDIFALFLASDIPQTGATTGQVLKWNGTSWAPADDSGSGSASWGAITGTLSSQTDLQSALDAKENVREVVTISGNTTLTAASHEGKRLFCTTTLTLTVNSSTDLSVNGKDIEIVAVGGPVTLSVSGATVNVEDGLVGVIKQYGAASLMRTDADTYILFGALDAA